MQIHIKNAFIWTGGVPLQGFFCTRATGNKRANMFKAFFALFES